MTDDDHGTEGARRTEHPFQSDRLAVLNGSYDQILRGPVSQFVGVLRVMRKRDHGGKAMRALQDFALRRPVEELVRLVPDFDPRDGVMLMTTAALHRPVGEAADMAVLQHAAELESGRRRAPITASIVHDVACQRTAFDVAVFVRKLKKRRSSLAGRTVRLFASPRSGRTSLDKALLHTALLDEGCGAEADRLLELTLRALADSPPCDAGAGEESEEIGDLAGAFRHLRPQGLVLERWLKTRLDSSDPSTVEMARRIAANLIARPGAGYEAFAQYIGREAEPRHLVRICVLLNEAGCPASGRSLRRQTAGHKGVQELAELVSCWYESKELTDTTRELLADIVAGTDDSGASPRSLDELSRLGEWLRQEYTAPECPRLLRHVAAVEVEGRSGGELVTLLGRVERKRERTRAAHKAGLRLARGVMRPGADRDWFVDCLRALHDAGYAVAVRAACRELSDPSSPGATADAEVVADVAGRLQRAGLHKASWTLLERFLENEQLVTPRDVVEVVQRVSALPLPDAELLLRATVGRWSDMGHRDAAVVELRAAGRREAADWVIKSLR
ncbi:hypothetical protein ACWD4G_21905 [Streptomyces sp. NPDC002643]